MAFDAPRNGSYFKPAENASAYAILIEVKEDRPNSRNNFGETKDAVIADITVFKTAADLAEGAEPKVFRRERIDHTLLQRELRDNVGVGNETIRQLGQWGDRKSWVWKYTDEDTRKAVIAWFERREGLVDAVAADPDTPAWMR